MSSSLEPHCDNSQEEILNMIKKSTNNNISSNTASIVCPICKDIPIAAHFSERRTNEPKCNFPQEAILKVNKNLKLNNRCSYCKILGVNSMISSHPKLDKKNNSNEKEKEIQKEKEKEKVESKKSKVSNHHFADPALIGDVKCVHCNITEKEARLNKDFTCNPSIPKLHCSDEKMEGLIQEVKKIKAAFDNANLIYSREMIRLNNEK